jgi:predicted nuclease of predicted toxin-antitoxin system
MSRADDAAVWDYAKANGFTLVSKDSDFHQMSFLEGHPPKVTWIRRGNCTTAEIAALLRERADDILRFHSDPDASFLALA